MKKNIMKVVFVAAIALVSGINVFNAHKSEVLSDVAMANVEALAQGEVEIPYLCAGDDPFCYDWYYQEFFDGWRQ